MPSPSVVFVSLKLHLVIASKPKLRLIAAAFSSSSSSSAKFNINMNMKMMSKMRPPFAAAADYFNLKLLQQEVTYYNHHHHQLCKKSKRMSLWSPRSAADGSSSSLDGDGDSSPTGGNTRLIRAIQAVQFKLLARFRELRKNLPLKLFSFLVGFYCATAFATVIGQTGDWDVLSAALTVAVVEGIGALMYKASLPLLDNMRNFIVIFNYWKTGLALGLFLDSFKY